MPPPPSPLPLPRFWASKISSDSVTNRELAKFWRQKHAEAAARKRALNLSEQDYKSFEESLSDEEYNTKQNITAPTNNSKVYGKNNEIHVGIKDCTHGLSLSTQESRHPLQVEAQWNDAHGRQMTTANSLKALGNDCFCTLSKTSLMLLLREGQKTHRN
ncbi:hypothetical protein V6N11_043844 [Hibiscus sabdariffa]|uniref:Uncharacterized protein n=1 Tax=Hibiscus sabdariffa TaxID=183260 RepID=A0ABR2RDF1_9ROSI